MYSLGMVLFEIDVWSRLDRYTKQNLDPEAFQKRIRDYVEKDLSLFMGDHFRQAVDACLSGEHINTTESISLDGEVVEEEGGLTRSEDLKNLPDDADSVELDGLCRHVISELNLCHGDMGGSLLN
jgi:hypothetical protein